MIRADDIYDDPRQLLVTRLRGLFDPEEIAYVLNVIDTLCHECWDAESGCSRARDE